MLSLHTNAAALTTQNAVSNTQRSLTTSMTRLGTGYRINSAMDDAAGLQIATRLEAQTSGMAVAQRNTQNGISMMQTAEGAFDEVSNIVLRMKDLATEAANGSSSDDDKTAMQAEYTALSEELTNIVSNTSFGGAKLLDGGTLASAVTYQIGASADETMTVDVSTELTDVLTGITATATDDLTTGASAAITSLDDLIGTVGTLRSQLGAASNRLDHVYNNLSNMSTNTAQAKSRITDVDFASETSNMTSQQLLLQAGTSMLKQSSTMSQLALSLLS